MKFKIKDEPFALGYMLNDGKHVALQVAYGLLQYAKDVPVYIDTEVGFAGVRRQQGGPRNPLTMDSFVSYDYGHGLICDLKIRDRKLENHPALADEINEIYEYFKDKVTLQNVRATLSESERLAVDTSTIYAGTWGGHGLPDYGLLLKTGTDGLREKINTYRELNAESGDWYDALLITLDALDILAERYADEARKLLVNADEREREVYERIIKTCSVVPKRPAYDFASACQAFYMFFMFDGIDSPGRFDQYMIDYYRKSDPAEARKLLEGIWIGLNKSRAWNLCIGGSDENWNDMSNELSYEILDVAQKYKFRAPNLTMRCHKNTPEDLLNKAVDTIATGIGMPVLYCDETVCDALEQLGIPPEHSHLYAMNGCNQIDIQGKSHMGLEDGEVSLIKCLEYALTDGVCLITGKQVGLKTGDGSNFKTFEDVFNAYKAQVEYITGITINIANRMQRTFAETAPDPIRSLLIEGCIESGRDYRAGGPLYGHGQILIEGLADTIDSLAAINYFVFDEKIVSMEEMIDAIKKDFSGYDELFWRLKNFEHKFGNDDDYVDDIAVMVSNHFLKYLLKFNTYRGGTYGGGLSTFQRTAKYGRATGATASGRHKGDVILADSIGSVPGCDVNGPTALLKSVLKYDQRLAKSGFVLNIKFDKKMFNTDKGKKNFLALVKAYFSNGGQQMSVNVLSREDLIAARREPDKYRNLIVRVGGYSDYFVKLSDGLKDNIIQRTTN